MKHNPLGKIGMVATPDTMKDLEKYLENYSGGERVAATLCALMAWNLASKIIDEQMVMEGQS